MRGISSFLLLAIGHCWLETADEDAGLLQLSVTETFRSRSMVDRLA